MFYPLIYQTGVTCRNPLPVACGVATRRNAVCDLRPLQFHPRSFCSNIPRPFPSLLAKHSLDQLMEGEIFNIVNRGKVTAVVFLFVMTTHLNMIGRKKYARHSN